MAILTAERLVSLAYKYPSLSSNWYIFASTALTVVNQPQEIGKVFHFALRQQLLLPSSKDKILLTDIYLLKLAEDSIVSAEKYNELSDRSIDLPDILIPNNYQEKLPLQHKFFEKGVLHDAQAVIASKIREAILKIAPISGLPKSINALTALKNVTPSSLRPSTRSQRTEMVLPGQVSSSALIQEDIAGTRFEDDLISTYDTIEGPISLDSINSKALLQTTVRGSKFWSAIYGKIKHRVRDQLYDAYPDLWQYAYHHVYSPILSYTAILSAKETSFCVICALVPQDVNPTLKGHLKGALNVGALKKEIEDLRLFTFDICDWSGNIVWKDGKDGVAKL